jgi:hypothetical protein
LVELRVSYTESMEKPGEFVQWTLVSEDGRASMRLRDAMVIGAGECCDLRLLEDGIAPHHALITVENGQLYVTPLAAAVTLVDGQRLQSRQHIRSRATLNIGAVSFKVRCEECRRIPGRADGVVAQRLHIDVQRPPIDALRVDHVPKSVRRSHRGRRRAGMVVAAFGVLAALVFWFLPQIDLDRPAVARLDSAVVSAAEEQRADAVSSPTPATPAPSGTPVPAHEDDRVTRAMAEADALYANGALITPTRQNAAAGYLRVMSFAPDDPDAKAKLSEIVSHVAADSQELIQRQQFNRARQMLDRLAAAIPINTRRFVKADALEHWHVVDLLLRADAMMQKYQIVEPENDNAVALLREALRIDPKNPVGDEMLAKAFGLLAETQQRQVVDAATTQTDTSD